MEKTVILPRAQTQTVFPPSSFWRRKQIRSSKHRRHTAKRFPAIRSRSVICLMLQMAPSFMPFFTKLLHLYFMVSILPLHRYSANPTTEKEQTFAMIKPDGVSGNYTSAIKNIILDSGFSITREVLVQLDEDTVRNFYAEHSKRSFFASLVQYMTSGPVLVMVLEKVNAVADWRTLIGPTDAGLAKVTHPQSIRAMCGLDKQRNCVHGSDSPQSAAREISFFITKSLTGTIFAKSGDLVKNYTPRVR